METHRVRMHFSESPLTISGSFQFPLPATGIMSSWLSPYQLKMSTKLWNESCNLKADNFKCPMTSVTMI